MNSARIYFLKRVQFIIIILKDSKNNLRMFFNVQILMMLSLNVAMHLKARPFSIYISYLISKHAQHFAIYASTRTINVAVLNNKCLRRGVTRRLQLIRIELRL